MTEKGIIKPSQQESIEAFRTGLEYLPAIMAEGGLSAETAEDILSKRNFVRGYEAAISHQSQAEFHEWFDAEVVGEYVGAWSPKSAALDGARAALQLNQTVLTEEQIRGVANSYKIIGPIYPDKPAKYVLFDKERK